MASESDTDSDTDNSDPPVRYVSVKSDAGVFSYDGYHLEFQNHRYARNIAQYIPALPLETKNGTAKVGRQPEHVSSKSAAFWEAQCALRGLSSHGTIVDLQDRLRGHETDPIAKNILEQAKKTFKQQNAEAREYSWVHDMSDEEKATKDPRRYLKETFPVGGTAKEPVLLSTHFVINIQETAEELGLYCSYTHAPIDGEAFLQMAKYWVVVGQDRSVVVERVRMIERESQRLKREQEEGQQELRRKNKALNRTKQKAEDAQARCKDWDVSGVWNINCPHIEEDCDTRDLTLKIYLERTAKGPQMFAEFDFGAIAGVFRFETLPEGARMTAPIKVYHDDTDEGSEEEDEAEYDEYDEVDGNDEPYSNSSDACDEKAPYHDRHNDDNEDDKHSRSSETPESFYFGSTTQPSKHPTWNYRYRGEETTNGVVDPGCDADMYTITFCAPTVRTLEGTFGGSAFGDCTFTGVKVDVNEPAELDISEEWTRGNKSSYGYSNDETWY